MAKEEKDKRFYKIYSRQVAKALYEKGFSIYKITPNPTLAGCKVYWFWVVDVMTNEAITLFIKKDVEVEQDRDADTRKNSIYLRDCYVCALTDATKACKITEASA